MAAHLSLRLPWHDRGWDGHVCDQPAANVYCCGAYGLPAHEIRTRKVDAEEEAIRGTPVQLLRPDAYRPPCLRTVQTFGGTRFLPFEHEPKEFLHTKRVRIDPVREDIPPSTAGTWPYDQVFRHADNAPEGTPDEFLERFSPGEAVRNVGEFFGAFRPKRSLVFFYLNFDNPLNSERRKYVLVGAAELDEISPQRAWEHIDEEKARVYGDLVWNRFVTHGYDDGRGARIPYERYLQKGLDAADVLVEVPEELAQHFKYVCRAFTDDEAVMLLRELAAVLERGKAAGAVPWDWDGQAGWVNRALDSVLRERGAFPGIAAALEALGFPRATLYVDRHIRAKGVTNARQHVLDRIGDPKLAEDADSARGYEAAARTLRVLPASVGKLLLDRLCLFELTADQGRMIAGGGLVADEDRVAAGLVNDAAALLDNPYLIAEEYDPPDPADRVAFHRIDQGIYLARAAGGGSVPGLETFAPDDRRRLRAAAVRCLRAAEADGHSFLLQDHLLRAVSRMRLPRLPESLGPVTLARDLEFYEQRLTVLREDAFTGWMFKTTAEDEELVRARVAKLQAQNPVPTTVSDWRAHLPAPGAGSMPPSVLEAVRESQAAVLNRLATQAISILTGGAGTGKTTVLAALIRGLQAGGAKEKFTLLTPTGKAAVRLRRKIKEVAGVDLEPRTIHSYLLGSWMDEDTFRPRRSGEPVADGSTTVVIDECSMLNTSLLATLFRAIDWRTVRRLILAGDPQQLPPIGAGAPFKNLVDHAAVSATEAHRPCALRVNCRQAQENSTALRLAEQFTASGSTVVADELLDQIRTGGRVGADLEVRYFRDETDLPHVLARLVGDAVEELLRLAGSPTAFDPNQPWVAFDELHGYGEAIDRVRLDAFEVLSPYRGNYYGSDALNLHLQALLRGRLMRSFGTSKLGNPAGRQFIAPDKVLQTRNRRLKVGDKVASVDKNWVDCYVANGELGRMMKVGKWNDERAGWVRFETNPSVSVRVDDQWARESLDLGYAMSVYKGQGSDFGGVVVVIPKEARQRLVSRELLYTALTRFTRRLYLLIQGPPGDPEALLSSLWRGSSEYLRRNTCLFAPRHAIPDLDDYRPEKRIVRTLRNELVLSKSEALIANLLFEAKVPYYYERPLVAPDGTFRRPDFTIPVETPDGPTELYWEHWGMLGDPDYDTSVERRKAWYVKHGYADRLLETDELGGFDSTKIEKLIRQRLSP
jgi:ATP-dependent exoDNAse (exonuclease V) alpha subunit